MITMSDLLHFHMLSLFLAKTPGARAYVAAGKYTALLVCRNFFGSGFTLGIGMGRRGRCTQA